MKEKKKWNAEVVPDPQPFGRKPNALQSFNLLKTWRLAPWARFELATLRLTAESGKNLSALSGVAYTKLGAILTSLAAPNPAPNGSHK
jgi:hypothetical protein